MTAIERKFADLKGQQQMALIPFITGGYPSLAESLDIVKLFSEHGADIVEIGIPFSDPIADGPTIQRSSQAALKNGVTLEKIMTALMDFRCQAPLVLMSYLNPILAFGPDRFFQDMAKALLAGIIIPDLPVEESTEFTGLAKKYHLALIQMAAPTSSDERIRLIAGQSQGFIYCVSTTGTTGTRSELPSDLLPFLRRVKRIAAGPIAVGFGISRTEQVQMLRAEADAVIVGSRIIKAIDNKEDLGVLINDFKRATRR